MRIVNEIKTRFRHFILRNTLIKAPLLDGIMSSKVDFLGVVSNYRPRHSDSSREIPRFAQDRTKMQYALKENIKLMIMYFCKFYHSAITLPMMFARGKFLFSTLSWGIQNDILDRPILTSVRAW